MIITLMEKVIRSYKNLIRIQNSYKILAVLIKKSDVNIVRSYKIFIRSSYSYKILISILINTTYSYKIYFL